MARSGAVELRCPGRYSREEDRSWRDPTALTTRSRAGDGSRRSAPPRSGSGRSPSLRHRPPQPPTPGWLPAPRFPRPAGGQSPGPCRILHRPGVCQTQGTRPAGRPERLQTTSARPTARAPLSPPRGGVSRGKVGAVAIQAWSRAPPGSGLDRRGCAGEERSRLDRQSEVGEDRRSEVGADRRTVGERFAVAGLPLVARVPPSWAARVAHAAVGRERRRLARASRTPYD